MTKLQWSGVGNVGGVQDPATAQRSARLFPNDGARGSGWLATWMGFLWPSSCGHGIRDGPRRGSLVVYGSSLLYSWRADDADGGARQRR